MSPTHTENLETMMRGSSQEQTNSNKATAELSPHTLKTSMNTAWQTTVNRQPSKTVETVRFSTPEIQFDSYAREALEGKYGPQAEGIARRAFPYSNQNKSTFEPAKAEDTAVDAVRILKWRNEVVETELKAAKEQLDRLKRDTVADVDGRVSTQPLTRDEIASTLYPGGTTDEREEANVDDIVEELRKMRDKEGVEAMDTTK